MAIRCVICDFGGVLTTPLVGSFMAFQDQTGIPAEALGSAMARIYERDGAHPLYELEKGHVTEHDFLASFGSSSRSSWDTSPSSTTSRRSTSRRSNPNEEMIAEMRAARDAGFRMAMLTNNVREWEPLWRAMLPVDEIFELVVDSAFVGMRKPEPEIYHLTLKRIREHDPDGAGGPRVLRVPLHRRLRGQLRGRERARHQRGPLRDERAGGRGDPRRARDGRHHDARGGRGALREERRRAPDRKVAQWRRRKSPDGTWAVIRIDLPPSLETTHRGPRRRAPTDAAGPPPGRAAHGRARF